MLLEARASFFLSFEKTCLADTNRNELHRMKSSNTTYFNRHPDIVVRAYKVYICLGCILLIEVVGIYSEIGYGLDQIVFWVLALVAYNFACITLAYILYHSGKFSLDGGVVKGMCKSSYNLVVKRKYSCSRDYMSIKFDLLTVVTY